LNKGLSQAKSNGFTLVEVLVASFLICAFAASFAFLVNIGIRQVSEGRRLTRSILLSKSIMEELQSSPFGALFSYNNTRFDDGAGLIIVAPAGNDLVSITVRDKIELNTLRSRYQP